MFRGSLFTVGRLPILPELVMRTRFDCKLFGGDKPAAKRALVLPITLSNFLMRWFSATPFTASWRFQQRLGHFAPMFDPSVLHLVPGTDLVRTVKPPLATLALNMLNNLEPLPLQGFLQLHARNLTATSLDSHAICLHQ